jgi:hypothetical protein
MDGQSETSRHSCRGVDVHRFAHVGSAEARATLRMVREAIASLDYVPYAPARVLRSGRPLTLVSRLRH